MIDLSVWKKGWELLDATEKREALGVLFLVVLLEPTIGEIRIDGERLRPENLRAWQKTVGYVPQDIFLTDASVTENIALGMASGEEDIELISMAARIANIDAFVMNDLPEGYDTIVGERGVRLSGGQGKRPRSSTL